MSLVLNGSGTITGLSAGGLPDATITQAEIGTNVAGTGPAFSAYNSASQSISAATFTKLTLDTENFDTNSNFASSRFTPTIAGYYQINASVCFATGGTLLITSVYKNGIRNSANENIFSGSLGAGSNLPVVFLVYMNGTTDYLELYAYSNSGAQTIYGNPNPTFLQGSLVRAA